MTTPDVMKGGDPLKRLKCITRRCPPHTTCSPRASLLPTSERHFSTYMFVAEQSALPCLPYSLPACPLTAVFLNPNGSASIKSCHTRHPVPFRTIILPDCPPSVKTKLTKPKRICFICHMLHLGSNPHCHVHAHPKCPLHSIDAKLP